ncbi:unnamed protein product [Cylindrotheca closterium]|uniref:Amine oxidase domain-containing protein n=1 Tax=Cylindrotheca closterium TaxID=2856 RepID=A0AAD2CGY4_9STRA|nr:unnamed protein product [Cylindrotheca closterium]
MVFWNKREKAEEKKEDDHHALTTDIQNNHDAFGREAENTDILTELNTDQVLDVVIIGAGWAGISAAATLKKKGIENFQVLEAKGYIGGRSFTHHEHWEGQDVPCDLGSMWIQNAKGNLLNEYIKKYKIPTHVSKYNTRIYEENGKGPMDDKKYNKLEEELYEKGFYNCQAARQQLAWMRGDEPLSKSRDLYLAKLKKKPLKQKLAKVLIRDSIELEYSGSLEELSLEHWNTDSWIGGSNSHDHFVMTGYSSLFYAYAKDEGLMDKIVTNAPISSINSTSNLVKLTLKDQRSITAKRVIVTAPLGVLQANAIEFIPALPKSHSKAIQRLGMGKMNKVFMFWKSEDVFWPMPTTSKIEVLGDVTDRDSTFLFYNSLSFHEEKPALYAFFKGPQVEQIELEFGTTDPEMYEEKITELAMECLQSMFGKDAVPPPEKVVVTGWLADEYTRGAYSFNKVGMKSKDREVLTFPIADGRIHFAGEATHEKYFATTTGAFLSGRNAAKKVVKKL